jgi:hypothetical protein
MAMRKSLRSRAEEQFAATQKKAKQALNEKEKARREIAERMAKQRALRMAKEAAEKEAAEQADAEKAAAKNKKPSRLVCRLRSTSGLCGVPKRSSRCRRDAPQENNKICQVKVQLGHLVLLGGGGLQYRNLRLRPFALR